MRDCDRWILDLFESRKKRNPSYSLRAFARDIGVTAGYLSRVFRGMAQMQIDLSMKILEEENSLGAKEKQVIRDVYLEEIKKLSKIKEKVSALCSQDFSLNKKVKLLNDTDYAKVVHWHFLFCLNRIHSYESWRTYEECLEHLREDLRVPKERVQEVIRILIDLEILAMEGRSLVANYESFDIQVLGTQMSCDYIYKNYVRSYEELEALTLETDIKLGSSKQETWGPIFFKIGSENYPVAERIIYNFFKFYRELGFEKKSEKQHTYGLLFNFTKRSFRPKETVR